MTQQDKRPENGRGKLLFWAGCLLVVLLAVVQIWVANRLATKGEVVRKYEVEAAWLREENQKRENEIVKLSSLGHIASRSGDLAFKEGTALIFLPRPIVVAFKED